MKTKVKKSVYRLCPYCKRVIPPQYNFDGHKKVCINVDKEMRPK